MTDGYWPQHNWKCDGPLLGLVLHPFGERKGAMVCKPVVCGCAYGVGCSSNYVSVHLFGTGCVYDCLRMMISALISFKRENHISGF